MSIEPTFQMPPQMSTFAADIDDLYYFIYWLSVALFIGIMGTAAYFVFKYKRKPGVKSEPTGHNMPLEIGWTVAPIFVLILLFNWGWRGYLNMSVAPADSIEIRARGFQWGWDFEYANGAHSSVLKLPVGKPVKMILSSNDVLHAFFIPQFRVKKDLVPGMYSTLWFQATETGQVDVFCAEYCGGRSTETTQNGHWAMLAKADVQTVDDFEKFLKAAKGPKEGESVPDWGARLATEKACRGCHSVDGSKGAGPSWKSIWSKKELTSAGEVEVDENYIRESILEPQAKIVNGFTPAMPTYKGILDDKEIDAIISYIKTLK